MRTLAELRAEIDRVDDELVSALNRRFALVAEIQSKKAAVGLPKTDATRESEIIARALSQCPIAERDAVCGVFETLFKGARGTIEVIARGVALVDGKVLVCKAKNAKSCYLPGGHVEFGETGREALVREVMEETGLDSDAGEFLGVIENSFMQHGKRHCEINLVYALTLKKVGQVVSREDWIEFEWCSSDALAAANLLPVEMRDCVKCGIIRTHG